MKRIDWTRRDFLKTAGMMAGAGYLKPLFSLVSEGKSIAGAYPEEVLHIEQYTKGKVKPGMIISKDNVELIKDIAPEGLVIELQRGNTQIKIVETTLEVANPPGVVPKYWIEATLRNKGKAVLDSKGQLRAKDGNWWMGGFPFPEPKTGLEYIWDFTSNNYRCDNWMVPAREHDIDSNGNVTRTNLTIYQQEISSGRLVLPPKPYNPLYHNELYREHLSFYSPEDVEGLQNVTIVYNDASKLPATYLYIPALRRVRRVPSTERFEPVAPNGVYFISDLGLINDPTLTWTYKLIGSKPMLSWSPVNRGLWAPEPRKDFTFAESEQKLPNSSWELRPEMAIVEGHTHLPGGNVYSRKLTYIDAVYLTPAFAQWWDRAGRLWKFGVHPLTDTGLPDHMGGTFPADAAICYFDVLRDTHTNVFFPRHNHWGSAAVNDPDLKIQNSMTPEAMLTTGMV